MDNIENAVREAALTLHGLILAAIAGGLSVTWPNRHEDLPAIAVSETKKAAVAVYVNASKDLPADVVAQASAAAQKAANEVIEAAAKKTDDQEVSKATKSPSTTKPAAVQSGNIPVSA